MRSCVMGRGVDTFSISSAIALASYTPTQMGSTVFPFRSFRITIGILVTGSIINPRIFISTSMGASPQSSLDHRQALAHQRIGSRSRHLHRHVLSHQLARDTRSRKIHCAIVGRPTDPLPGRLISSFHQHFAHCADHLRIPANLDRSLLLLHHREPALLLLFRYAALHRYRGGIWPWRILEAEQGVVFDLVE